MLSRIFGRQQPKRDFPKHTDLPRFTEAEANRALLARRRHRDLSPIWRPGHVGAKPAS